MPVMVVILSAAGNSFSGAHYDGAVYMRNCRVVQRFIEQRSLNRYLDLCARDWVSRNARTRSIPEQWEPKWTWPVAPYVNPKDQYDAVRARLEDGTISYSGAVALFGEEAELIIRERVADNARLERAGLPPLPVRPNFSGKEAGPTSEETSDPVNKGGKVGKAKAAK